MQSLRQRSWLDSMADCWRVVAAAARQDQRVQRLHALYQAHHLALPGAWSKRARSSVGPSSNPVWRRYFQLLQMPTTSSMPTPWLEESAREKGLRASSVGSIRSWCESGTFWISSSAGRQKKLLGRCLESVVAMGVAVDLSSVQPPTEVL